MFTKVLIDGLKGAADKDGYEPDGVVTVDELDTYLEKEMPKLARAERQDERGEGAGGHHLGREDEPLRPDAQPDGDAEGRGTAQEAGRHEAAAGRSRPRAGGC